MPTIQVPIGEYVFDVTEAGPAGAAPVVLLHGFPQTSASFGEVARLLAADGFRTVALDQRGYSPGARPLNVADYEMVHLVADVLGLLDALGVEKADLVGHDWGSVVAWNVAAHAPERVRTLTAVSVPHPRAFFELLTGRGADADEQREKSAYMQLFRMAGGKAEEVLLSDGGSPLRAVYTPIADRLRDPHIEALSRPGALTAALNWYRAMEPKAAARVAAVSAPTTFVWSNGDVAIGRAAAEGCAAHVTGEYAFVELDGVSHWIPDEAPAALAAAIASRVRSVPA